MGIKKFSSFNSRKFLRDFFRRFPQHAAFRPKDNRMSELSNVITAFHEEFISEVVSNRYGAELPLNMGAISVVGYKKNRFYPNFSKYSTSGEITDFANIHTEGLACKIYYTNGSNRYRLKDRFLWEFLPSDPFKKQVSEVFSKEYHRFVVNPDIYKIFHKHIDSVFSEKMNLRIDKFLLTYDEFNFA